MRTIVCLWLVVGVHVSIAHTKDIFVKFHVELPRHFNSETMAYIAGNHTNLGNWDPKGLILKRTGNYFSGDVQLPCGYPVEFKVTLGDWHHAEVSKTGGEIPNRMLYCKSDCAVFVSVANIRLHAKHPVPETAATNIFYHHDLYSQSFENYRSLAVFVPQDYLSNALLHYPVLYALDGNNLFDRVTSSYGVEWRMDETLNSAFRNGMLPPFIVVGIYSTKKRPEEYLSCRDPLCERGGMAEHYARYLQNEIKPFIDNRYRTLRDREHNWLLGSSFGGHFTLFAARHFGATFSRFVAMSPAFWWGEHCLFPLLSRPFYPAPTRLWMDMGDREGWDDGAFHFKNGVNELHTARSLLLNHAGIPAKDLMAFVDKGAIHHESAWGARLLAALRFVLGR